MIIISESIAVQLSVPMLFTHLLQEGPEWTIDEDWILLKVMHAVMQMKTVCGYHTPYILAGSNKRLEA